jgi:tetratricopeptide (TPR) repeat protein
MEEMRITARRTPEGDYVFSSYDAEGLFKEATGLLNRGECPDAVQGYDRIVAEFAGSVFASPALYNAGLCLQRMEQPTEAVARFERLVETQPDSPDINHAHFQLAKLYVALSRWDDAIASADRLLATEGLSPDERIEAMARRAQALLGDARFEDAERQARTALGYYRSGSEKGFVRDDQFAAAANFVLAETQRQQAHAIQIPEGGIEAQRPVLERRAQLVLEAQREYFNTIGFQQPKWAAASGYRIGEMYDAFWHAILRAPVPPPRRALSETQMPIYEEEYRKELQRLIRPLIRHAIRYWELTLMMVERTGVDTDWGARIRDDLERARDRLLEQPEGEADLPEPGVPSSS